MVSRWGRARRCTLCPFANSMCTPADCHHILIFVSCKQHRHRVLLYASVLTLGWVVTVVVVLALDPLVLVGEPGN